MGKAGIELAYITIINAISSFAVEGRGHENVPNDIRVSLMRHLSYQMLAIK